MRTFVCAVVLLASFGCGGDDGGDDAAGSESTGAAESSGGSTDEGDDTTSADGSTDGGSTGEPPGGAIDASGSLNGTPLEVTCDMAYYDQVGNGALLQCQDGTGLHMIQCRAEMEDAHGVMGQAFVMLQMYAQDVTVGDNVFTEALTGVNLAGTLDPVGLNPGSSNAGDNVITVDAFEEGVGASGSFTASWSDDGMSDYGEISGTFDFACPG